MATITAARLHLRAPDGWSVRAQARVEDALRTSVPDDHRLVVLKRLDLGHMPLGAPPLAWSARTGARLAAMTQGAVHAALPGASQADAVWFANPAEALRRLLVELAAGRNASAWFWRLALPDWHGDPLGPWLQRLLIDAEHDPQALVELAQAVMHVAAVGGLAALLDALSAAARPAPTARALPVMHPAANASASSANASASPVSAPAPPSSAAIAVAGADAATVIALLERLPAHLRTTLVTIWQRLPANSAAAQIIARLALVSAAPELAAMPSRRAVLEAALPALVRAAGGLPAIVAPGTIAPPAAPPDPTATARIAPQGPRATPSARAPAAPAATAENPPSNPRPAANVEPAHEQHSRAAGLWLLIRPLHVMGLGEWLEKRPDIALDGFARALLMHIADRQRIPATDLLYTILAPTDRRFAPDLLDSWRIGLDRWLRKRTRRSLAHVTKRPGWLLQHDSGVAVRFRLDQADIALRRRALDVDAGWVPWLGLSVRYHFRDTPLQ